MRGYISDWKSTINEESDRQRNSPLRRSIVLWWIVLQDHMASYESVQHITHKETCKINLRISLLNASNSTSTMEKIKDRRKSNTRDSPSCGIVGAFFILSKRNNTTHPKAYDLKQKAKHKFKHSRTKSQHELTDTILSEKCKHSQKLKFKNAE